MKLFFTFSCVCILLFAGVTPLLSQQTGHQTIPLNAPSVINFKELAAYQLEHPQPKTAQRFIEQGEDREGKREIQPQIIAADAKKFNVNLPQNTLRTVSPSPAISFGGVSDNGTLIPPDVSGAVGNNFVMQSSNQEFDIYNKPGTLNSTLDIANFFVSTDGMNYFDPHVVYDASHKRFVVCVDGFYSSDYHSALFIGISQTPDPTGAWYIYSIDAVGNSYDFLDYPTVGFNNNWVVVTGNDFTSYYNSTTQIYVFNRADLYSGSAGTVHNFSDANIFDITPAVTTDTTQNTEFMVADWDGNNGGYGYMKLYKITGTASSPSYSAGNTMGVSEPWDENSVNAPQHNSTHEIEVGDTRVSAPIYIKGSLWFTHTVFLPAGNPTHAAVDWWQVNPATYDLLQFGRIEDNTGSIFYYYPSISVNSEDDALIGYSVSSSGTYVSAAYSFHSSLDAANTMEDNYTYKQGLASYWKDFGSGRNRWGDFSATATDPVDNSFWTFQEFASSPANTWGTYIANVGGVPCDGTPTAGFITPVFSSVCPGDATILNLTGYSSGISGIQLQWQQSVDGVSGWADANGIGNAAPRYETGVLNQAAFYRCIVTCSVSGLSDTTDVFEENVNGFVPIANDTICSPGLDQLIATTIGTTHWYVTDTSSIPFFTGDTLNANVSGDTTFYISTSTLDYASVGIPNSVSGSYYNYTFSAGLVFQATSNFTIDTVYVYAGSTGTVKVNLYDAAAGKVTDSVSVTITSAQVSQKRAVPLHFAIAGGALYNLNAAGSTVSGIYRTSSGALYPYDVPGVMAITQAINNAQGYYYFFYDWRITTGCASEMFPVSVHIDVPNVVAYTPIDTICFGEGIALFASGASAYLWQPGNLTGSAVGVQPLVSTTYTVTGTDLYGCTNSSEINVTVKTCAVGIEETLLSPGVHIFPNPTSGTFDIHFDELHAGDYTVTLWNLFGQKVKELNKEVSDQESALRINVPNLPTGIYFLRVAFGNQQWMNRVVKE